MPKYQTPEQRKERYDILVKGYGEQCLICKMKDGVRRGPPRKKLIIEHVDNDRTNWSWNNIYLCCYSHNKIMESWKTREKITRIRGYIDLLEREREREGLPTLKDVLKERLDYEGASTEIQLNRRYHRRWLKYLHRIIGEEGTVPRKTVIADCGNYAGCSRQTSENYLLLATARNAPFQETLDDDGNKIVRYRENGGK